MAGVTGAHAPSAAEIAARVFAVHGTNSFPVDGVIRAGCALPAHFRPGPHFALGGLSGAMARASQYRFAVIAPLGELAPQLVSIGPSDTFVLGDVALTARTTLVLPEGTATQGIAGDVPVVGYPARIGLPCMVDRVIRAAGGWPIAPPESFEIDSPAMFGRCDVNRSGVFADFLAAHPRLAFGGHAASEVGDAALFGMVDRLVQGIAHAAAQRDGLPGFVPAVLADFVDRIDAAAQWPPSLRATLDAAVAHVRGWIGRVRPNGDPRIAPGFAAEVLSVLSPSALRTIRAPAIVAARGDPQFALDYATRRWLTVTTPRARREGLDRIFADAADRWRSPAVADAPPRWPALLHYHRSAASNRRADAEAIWRSCACRALVARTRFADANSARPQDLSVTFRTSGRC